MSATTTTRALLPWACANTAFYVPQRLAISWSATGLHPTLRAFLIRSPSASASYSCSIGRRDDSGRERDDLTYPEWVELLGLIAYTLGDEKLRGMRPDLVTSLGATAEGGPGPGGVNMLQRLRLLFVNMFELGARFEGDGLRMIRAISDAVRRDAAAVRDASMRAAAYAASNGRHVRSVLGESVML